MNPALSTASSISFIFTLLLSKITVIFSVARFTLTLCTPETFPTTFSILRAHDAQLIPSKEKVLTLLSTNFAKYPAFFIVCSISSVLTSSSLSINIFSVARFTLTFLTPEILPTIFSILLAQEAQLIPSILYISFFIIIYTLLSNLIMKTYSFTFVIFIVISFYNYH